MDEQEEKRKRAKERPERPYKNEQDLRIKMSPEALAQAVLSGKGVKAEELA